MSRNRQPQPLFSRQQLPRSPRRCGGQFPQFPVLQPGPALPSTIAGPAEGAADGTPAGALTALGAEPGFVSLTRTIPVVSSAFAAPPIAKDNRMAFQACWPKRRRAGGARRAIVVNMTVF